MSNAMDHRGKGLWVVAILLTVGSIGWAQSSGDRTSSSSRSYGTPSFGIGYTNSLRVYRSLNSTGFSGGLEARHTSTGRVFSRSFSAVNARVSAEASYVNRTSTLSTRISGSVTLGGRYTWTPFDRQTNDPYFSISRQFSQEIFRIGTTVFVGPVPVNVEASAGASLNVYANAGPYISNTEVGVSGRAGATASLTGSVFGGIGTSYMGVRLRVGIEANLTLMELTVEVSGRVTTRQAQAALDVTMAQRLLLNLVAEGSIPGLGSRRWTVNIVNYTLSRSTQRVGNISF